MHTPPAQQAQQLPLLRHTPQGCTQSLHMRSIAYSRGLQLRQRLAPTTTQTYLACRLSTHLSIRAPERQQVDPALVCYTKQWCSTQTSSARSNGTYQCVDHAAKHGSLATVCQHGHHLASIRSAQLTRPTCILWLGASASLLPTVQQCNGWCCCNGESLAGSSAPGDHTAALSTGVLC